ncbi:hypothetical protein [Thermoflexus hugenholtzii]
MGSERVFLEARPWAPNFLNVVLDTATLPAANHNYPSWGTVRLQWIDPLTTLSRYVARKDQLSPETFRAWGCARGESLPPWGWGTVILDFGYPRIQNEEYGVWLLNLRPTPTFISTTVIADLARAFLTGFAECNGTARLYLALGVNNHNRGKGVTRDHGRAWARMINQLNQDIWNNPHWLGRFWALGAIDAEPDWNTAQTTREWVEGYTEAATSSTSAPTCSTSAPAMAARSGDALPVSLPMGGPWRTSGISPGAQRQRSRSLKFTSQME